MLTLYGLTLRSHDQRNDTVIILVTIWLWKSCTFKLKTAAFAYVKNKVEWSVQNEKKCLRVHL